MSAGDAATIASAVQDFADALALAESNLTRTPTTVNAKDTKRNAAETLCRQFAIQIKFTNGIMDEQKIAIGIRPVNPDREPINCPQTSPVVNLKGGEVKFARRGCSVGVTDTVK